MNFIESVESLEEQMATPSALDRESVRRLKGDFIVLGAGGKMGPSLARRIRRAANAEGVRRKVIAVSRFSSLALVDELNRDGMPSRFSSSTRASDENRDTAMTLRRTPSAFAARLILRASEGPIFPPAPKTMKSPFSRRTDSRSSALGVAICSSRLSTDSIKFMNCTFRGYRLQFYRALQLFRVQLLSTQNPSEIIS